MREKEAPDDPTPLTECVCWLIEQETVELEATRYGIMVTTPKRQCLLDSPEGYEWLTAVSVYFRQEPPFVGELPKVVDALTMMIDFGLGGAA